MTLAFAFAENSALWTHDAYMAQFRDSSTLQFKSLYFIFYFFVAHEIYDKDISE